MSPRIPAASPQILPGVTPGQSVQPQGLQPQPVQDPLSQTPAQPTVVAPEDQNGINPLLQGPPAGNGGPTAEQPSQVSFVEQNLSPHKGKDKGTSIGEERPGTFAQLGMMAAMALAGPVAPSLSFDPVLKRVSAKSFLEKSPDAVAGEKPQNRVDTRLRSDETPPESTTPAPQQVPVVKPLAPQKPVQEPESEPPTPPLA